MSQEYKGQKFSRKTKTIIWDKEQKLSRPGSVIKIFDPEAKEDKFFMFVSNPDETLDAKDIKIGRTSSLGAGTYARTKFVVPVKPLEGKNGEFVNLNGDEKPSHIVRIFNSLDKQNYSIAEQKKQRDSNQLFTQIYGTQVLHAELKNSNGKRKSYTILPYMGMGLNNLINKCHQKINEQSSSYTTDLLDIKQALQLGLAISKTLNNNFHQKKRCHYDAHRGNWLVQIQQDPTNPFIANLVDLDRVSSLDKDGVQHDLKNLRGILRNLYQILGNKRCTIHQGTLSILGKINVPLSDESSLPMLIQSQSAALTEIEKLLQGKAVDETQGLLYSCINPSPVSPKSDWENLIDTPPSAQRDEAKQALLTFLGKNLTPPLDQLLSEKFLAFVYRYNPPLLTPEEFQKLFAGLSEEQFNWVLTKVLKLNLPNLLSTLIPKMNPSHKNELLGKIVILGHTEMARLLIENGADIHKKYALLMDYSHFHQTLLHWAIYKNNVALTELLLDAGAHINLQNSDQQAPLHYAIIHSANIPLIKLLLERGANPNLKGENLNSKTLLSVSELIQSVPWNTSKQREEARHLISTYQMHPPLCDAAAKDDSKKADRLLKNGANPTLFINDAKDANHQKTPLMIAASMGHIETLKVLLKCKEVRDTINDSNEAKKNALHYAIEENQHKAKHILLQHGAHPPLHLAVQKQNISLVILLLQTGADINSVHQGDTPLDLAMTTKNPDLIKLLLESGADPTRQPYHSLASIYHTNPPLCDAAETDNHGKITQLLKNGANPALFNNNAESKHYGKNALMIAASTGNIEAMKALLSSKEVRRYINQQSSSSADTATALHYAVRHNHFEAVELLLNNGADPNLKNALGHTPLTTALYFGQDKPEIVESLLREGKYSNDQKNEALRIAVNRGHYDTAASLVIYGADTNLKYIDSEGNSLLTLAVRDNKEESFPFITALLKNKNTKVNHCNNHGDTALSLAVWNDNSKIAKQLLEARANPFLIAPDDKMPFIASSQIAYLKNPPILEAVKRNDIELVAELLRDKANLTQKNQLGQTALDIAREKNHVDIVKCIFLAAAEHHEYDMMHQAYDALPENKTSKWQAYGFYCAAEYFSGHLCDELYKIIKANENYLRSSFARISSLFSKIPVLSSDQLGKCRSAFNILQECQSQNTFISRELNFVELKEGQHPFIAKQISILQRCCEYTRLSHAAVEVREESSVPETKESKSTTLSSSSSPTCSSSFLPGPRNGKPAEFDLIEPEKPLPEYYPEMSGSFFAGELPTLLGPS